MYIYIYIHSRRIDNFHCDRASYSVTNNHRRGAQNNNFPTLVPNAAMRDRQTIDGGFGRSLDAGISKIPSTHGRN